MVERKGRRPKKNHSVAVIGVGERFASYTCLFPVRAVIKIKPENKQTLQPTDPPIFEVMNMFINETVTQVALWGNLGIAIMELPKRWGKDTGFQGGKDTILCASPLTAAPPNPDFKTPD
ncbi:hypothetical protein HZH68_016549 [Vespula germanica]|uniref:Uncharacterized protein n=1 Tax=Vespula germanica TaxID=30212 RepID=A0A834J589_VESGE|nr:hypothetical protein HZH68_016549 [Vespula germanica]